MYDFLFFFSHGPTRLLDHFSADLIHIRIFTDRILNAKKSVKVAYFPSIHFAFAQDQKRYHVVPVTRSLQKRVMPASGSSFRSCFIRNSNWSNSMQYVKVENEIVSA